MNYRKISFVVLGLLTLYAFSCEEKRPNFDSTYIRIDFDNVATMDISDTSKVKVIPLETTDNSLLYEIQAVEFLDDKIFVFNRNNVAAFDSVGNFLFNVGGTGAGPGEYQQITTFFIDEKKIHLFDIAMQRILIYDSAGQYLSSLRIDPPNDIAIIYPIDKHAYITKNRYMGADSKTPGITFLDNRYSKIRDVEHEYLDSNDFDQNCFYAFNNEVLYWKFLNDTIYSIVQQKEKYPKYIVDFQEYAIPKSVRKTNDTDAVLEYINNSSNPNMASMVRYVQEDSLYVRFCFLQKEAIINYVRFNKITNEVETSHITDSGHTLSPEFFMLYKDGKIIISAGYVDNNDEENPVLVFINEETK